MATPDKKVDFDSEWKKVASGLEVILNAPETGQGLKQPGEWMNYYNSVFNLAIAQHEEKTYIEVARIFERFVRVQSKKIFEKTGGELMLKEYLRIFNGFTKTALCASRICNYLQRYWISGNLGKVFQTVEVRNVYPLGLVMWRQHCFEPIKDKLIPSLLDLVDLDRNGTKQDKTLIRNLVQSYIEFDKVGPNEGQAFYEKEFEARYIDRLKRFYQIESSNFLQMNGVSLYLKKAEDRIEEEKQNAEYLGTYHATSEPKIKKALDEVLIEKHMDVIQADFLRMLKEEKSEDMRRVYFLLSRVADGLSHTSQTFEVFIKQEGDKIVKDQKKKGVKEALDAAVVFVKQLLAFHQKFEMLVNTNFSSSHLFKNALDRAFREVMNLDSGKFNIPRLLNHYIDHIIKGKEKELATEDDIDEVLARLVALFSYLADKDEFFEYFRKSLCKRLLSKSSNKGYLESAEKAFLTRLKAQTGDAAVRRLQGMFTDVQEESIRETNTAFTEWNKGSNKIGAVELEVQVLNESHWPISGPQKFHLGLGQQLYACQQKFQEFYGKKTEKRKLQWLYNFGTTTLNGRFTNSKMPIQFVVTPLQASILMCFTHERPKITFEELMGLLWPNANSEASRTMLTSSGNQVGGTQYDMTYDEILRYAVQPLVYWKYKVLQKEKDDDPAKENINRTDVFMLRDKIPAKKLPRKIAFPGGSAQQTQHETKVTQAEVLKQREFEIDAAMVRVMKARNRCDWNQLQIETTNILKHRFNPDPKMTKKRLESLIDRKFMERDENNPKILIYIS